MRKSPRDQFILGGWGGREKKISFSLENTKIS